MQLRSFDDASEYLREVDRDFSRHEVEHHLMLGLVHDIASRRALSRPASLVTVRHLGDLVLASVMTEGRPLLLESDRPDVEEPVAMLAAHLVEQGKSPTAVIAGEPHATGFCEEWKRATKSSWRLSMRQRQYVVRSVMPVARAAGSLRQATPDDLPLVSTWMGAFHAEAMSGEPDPELRERVERRLQLGEIYLWDDGEPRSMAASARPTRRGIAINGVFTPPEWRGRGFATSCVAALSERLLSEGRDFCVLYTDMANPTSNAIYTRIGYRPVGDSVLIAISRPQSA